MQRIFTLKLRTSTEERAAEMEEFSDADTAAEAEEAENTEFNEVTE